MKVNKQHADNRMERNSFLSGALKGAVAGAIGVWVLDRLDWFDYEHEDPESGGAPKRFVLVEWIPLM